MADTRVRYSWNIEKILDSVIKNLRAFIPLIRRVNTQVIRQLPVVCIVAKIHSYRVLSILLTI